MELFEAVSKNDVFKVMKLLEEGVDPNQLDIDQHYTALHHAVQNNAPDVVLLLVTAGADLNAKTEENLTVFDLARQARDQKMLHLLIRLFYMKATVHRKRYLH